MTAGKDNPARTTPERGDGLSARGHGRDAEARPRIAVAHDWLVGLRGGEAVLDRVLRLVERVGTLAGLYTMFDEHRSLTGAIDATAGVRRVSFLNAMPGSASLRRWLLPLYPLGVADLSRRLARASREAAGPGGGGAIDLLISTSSAAVHGLGAPPGVPHLCYCHTPPRYLWMQRAQYAGGLRGIGLRVLGPLLRRADLAAAQRVTHWIANSTHTREQIDRCYSARAEVVFPPVDTEFFTPGASARGRDEPYLLAAGALEPYKRFDLAIGAALAMRRRVVVVGRGSDEARLRRMAGGSTLIEFVGHMTREPLRDLYRGADCLIFPQVEDFGITAVEALACGTPVVALRAGGALDTMVDGETGRLFDDQTVESLAAAVRSSPRRSEVAAACRTQALRFSHERFDREMLVQIQGALGRA